MTKLLYGITNSNLLEDTVRKTEVREVADTCKNYMKRLKKLDKLKVTILAHPYVMSFWWTYIWNLEIIYDWHKNKRNENSGVS